jgi:hypothetical protein
MLISCAVLGAAVGASVTIWQHAQHARSLPKASCGSATTHFIDGNTQVFAADPGALTCFDAAAQRCRAASIEMVAMGVDTGTDYVFTIEPGGTACQVTEQSQYYSANFGGSTGPVVAVACVRTGVTGRGVALSCGGQAVLIPSGLSGKRPGGI